MRQSAPQNENEPRLNSVTCLSPAGLHRMAYWEWGNPANDKVLVCVHGLTRTGRDFDRLARRLSADYRVVCPDIVGRGQSSWLVDPAFYVVPQYVADMIPLLARINAKTVHWFGTSLGGLIGLGLASLPGSPVQKLILNDVGPRLDPVALDRIGSYVGRSTSFDSFEAAVTYVRTVSASFGEHTDEQWRELTRFVVKQADGPTGPWTTHYDPSIALAFRSADPRTWAAAEAMLWNGFENIGCPVLVVRGADSDLLTEATAQEMLQRNPRARLAVIPGVGHAPTFMSDAQIELANRFLLDAQQ